MTHPDALSGLNINCCLSSNFRIFFFFFFNWTFCPSKPLFKSYFKHCKHKLKRGINNKDSKTKWENIRDTESGGSHELTSEDKLNPSWQGRVMFSPLHSVCLESCDQIFSLTWLPETQTRVALKHGLPFLHRWSFYFIFHFILPRFLSLRLSSTCLNF